MFLSVKISCRNRRIIQLSKTEDRDMKSAWVTGKKKIELIEKEYPKPGTNEVTVKVMACGICGTDLHFYHEFPGGDAIPLGHEVAGYVHEIGEGVDGVNPGDRVVVQNNVPCGACRSCLQGNPYTCSNIQTYMNDRAAMAELLSVPRNMLVPFSGLDYGAAAVAEPLTVAFDITREAGIEPFQDVLVSGPGIIGLFCTALVRKEGARNIAVLGRKFHTARGKKRAEAAKDMGADEVFDTDEPEWREKIKKRFPRGFERIIVTSPPQTILPLLELACFGGRIAYNGISYTEETIAFNANDFHFKKLKLIASHAIPNWGFPLALDLLAGKRMDYDGLITHEYPFERLDEAFATASSPDQEVIKVVVTFGD
jgi:L-iditol 2-dehydrogenase